MQLVVLIDQGRNVQSEPDGNLTTGKRKTAQRLTEGDASMSYLMNRAQRVVIGAAIVLILLACLFPPYVGKLAGRGGGVYMGHRFLLAPPSREKVFAAIEGKAPEKRRFKDRFYWPSYARYSAIPLTSVVWVEVGMIVFVAGGVVLLVAKKRDVVK